jgi:methionine aminopeptidase
MKRFNNKTTYIIDANNHDRSYDMTSVGDVMAITAMLNNFEEATNSDLELKQLRAKLDRVTKERNQALKDLVIAEGHVEDLCHTIEENAKTAKAWLELSPEKQAEQTLKNRTIKYERGDKIIS